MRRILFARRAIVACAAVFVLAAPAAAQTPPSSTGFFSGISDVASLRRMVEEAVVRSDEHLDALLKVEGRRSVENTLVPFDRMVMELSNASGTAGVIARLHPDEAMQLAAQQLAVDVGARATSLGLREDIYRAIKAIDVQADPLARRYVDTIVRSAELNGVNKAEDVEPPGRRRPSSGEIRIASITAPPSTARPELVLLVEDEDLIRSLAEQILADRGYQVISAANASEALELVSRLDRELDLLVTDVVMPGLSGLDLAQRLQRRLPRLRILFMSGYADSPLLRAGLAQGGSAFLQKPFSADALERRVRELLDSPRPAV